MVAVEFGRHVVKMDGRIRKISLLEAIQEDIGRGIEGKRTWIHQAF